VRPDPDLYRHVILGLWSAWALFWFISAMRAKATVRREPLRSRYLYVVLGIIGGLLIGWPTVPGDGPSGAVGWLDGRLWPPTPISYWIGLALLCAGLAFAVWARVELGRNWSGSVTVKEGHELIRSGPYGYVRHPIYTGLIAALLGTAATSGSVRGFLGVALIVASFLRKMSTEERFMRDTFPEEYARYSARVPALIPFTNARRSAAG
jgi:protein-S-isoprenylcysteine O-methyltransferase Ste14